MKKIFGFIGSYTFYYLGHGCSKTHHLFKGYQKFMYWSLRIQDWANNKTPWIGIR